jgi:hypothetical protein
MKIFFSLLIITAFNCQKSTENNNPPIITIKDTVIFDNTEKDTIKSIDTINVVSNTFKVNNILCYWEASFILEDFGFVLVKENLKEYTTKKILFEYSTYESYEFDSIHKDYYGNINENDFIDYNFDGFKDLERYSKGSVGWTSMENIYLFDPKTKLFVYSEYLSDNQIQEIDTINKILVMSGYNSIESYYTKTHFFNKKGKIKYTKVETETYDHVLDSAITTIEYIK